MHHQIGTPGDTMKRLFLFLLFVTLTACGPYPSAPQAQYYGSDEMTVLLSRSTASKKPAVPAKKVATKPKYKQSVKPMPRLYNPAISNNTGRRG
jgi:hypothetical protein